MGSMPNPPGRRHRRGGGRLLRLLRDGDDIFHTYSAYARGLDHTDLGYALLDLTAFGRQEGWEEPKGRVPAASPA